VNRLLASAFDQIAYWQPSRRWVQVWSNAGTFFWNRANKGS
jgi:hypothetical protein